MFKGQIAGLMRQAQQMQEKVKKAQEELAAQQVEAQAGSGLVKVVVSGKHELVSLQIDLSLMTSDPDDRETLQDLIMSAVNDANRRIEAISAERMSAATAGLPLPPGFKL